MEARLTALTGSPDDWDPLVARAQESPFAVLGEASHGTHEFPRERAELPAQFDAVIHFDGTHALEPLELNSEWEAGELPEIYPYAV